MLTGRLPFVGSSPVAVAMKQVSQPLPAELLKDVPEDLAAVVKRALEKEAEKRYASAEDFETELALLKLGAEARRDKPADDVSQEVETAFQSILVPSRPGPFERPKVTIPVASASAPPKPAAPRVPLVLVGNEDVRALLKLATAVCQTGCKTLEVRTGQEALELLMREPINLVVLDVELPGMDGFDVTRILKAQPSLAEVPVLLTTRRADRSQLAFAIQSGAADLLTQPVPQPVLHEAVWKVLHHRGFPRVGKDTSKPGARDRASRSRLRRP